MFIPCAYKSSVGVKSQIGISEWNFGRLPDMRGDQNNPLMTSSRWCNARQKQAQVLPRPVVRVTSNHHRKTERHYVTAVTGSHQGTAQHHPKHISGTIDYHYRKGWDRVKQPLLHVKQQRKPNSMKRQEIYVKKWVSK